MDKWKKILLRTAIVLVLGLLFRFAPTPYHVTRNFREAQTALAEEDFQTVAENLVDIAEHLPWRVELWESAGDYAFQGGDFALARYAFEQAGEGDTLSDSGRLALGDVYLTAGEPDLAEETWTLVGDSPESLRRLAGLHRDQADIPTTITDLESLLASGPLPDETDLHHQLGLLLTAHDPQQAIPHLEAALDDHPQARTLVNALEEIPADSEAAYAHIVAGQALASLNEWSLAQYSFQRSVDVREDYAEAWAYLGEALQHGAKDDEEALSALQKALALDPNSFSATMFTGLYWQRQGQPEQALPYFESAAELAPDLPEAYVELGQTLAALGQYAEAEKVYQEAIAKSPQEAQYYQLLAQFCVQYHHKVRELGLPAARQAVWLNEEDPASWDAMGLVMLELEDAFNAERALLRAVDLDPGYALALAANPSVVEHAQHLLGYFEE